MGIDNWAIYFDQLCQMVVSQHTPSPRDYTLLLWQLHNTEFVPKVRFDENRLKDALIFRRQVTGVDIDRPVGMFEMMVSLAERIERDTMGGTADWDRTAYWFWEMVESLGLTFMTNKRYDKNAVTSVVRRFLSGGYSSDGSGGLFTTANPDIDMRKRDIWRQAATYLNEVLRDEGVLE